MRIDNHLGPPSSFCLAICLITENFDPFLGDFDADVLESIGQLCGLKFCLGFLEGIFDYYSVAGST
jgi:hypothetical protein